MRENEKTLAYDLLMDDRIQLEGWHPFRPVERVGGKWRYFVTGEDDE